MSDSDDSSLLAAIALTLISGVGPRIGQNLLNHFGTEPAILAASERQLAQVPGVGPKIARAVREKRDLEDARRELDRCRELNVRLVKRGEEGYPRLLDETPDPPRILYCRGELTEQDGLSVAIVGSRRCTPYGRKQAEHLARSLARAGMTIVSGLARGIDAAAHQGALAAGGRTVAVMATGLASVYPPEHADLARTITEQGATISESPLDQAPIRGLFPQRNRIISGMSLGVILVEASRNSGALHTARHALE
ncbi:MAG: DNA-processing protein DprA, partial [Planctomycetaceae bacterium]